MQILRKFFVLILIKAGVNKRIVLEKGELVGGNFCGAGGGVFAGEEALFVWGHEHFVNIGEFVVGIKVLVNF